MQKIILIINFASTLFLMGVIWLIQIVQYPFFAQVGAENFPKYHTSHTFWITPIVAPAMILELVTSTYLLFFVPENVDIKLIWIGLALTLTVWLSTFFSKFRCTKNFRKDSTQRLINF